MKLLRRILPIVGIILVIWLLLLLGMFILASFIINLSVPIPGVSGQITTNILRVLLGLVMAVVWLYIWKKLAETYFWKSMSQRRQPTRP